MAKNDKYLHGFEVKEQQRLLAQARFLEPYIFAGVDLEFDNHLLEVGCGVGAQTKIMCRRFPDLKIWGLDLSEAQLAMAKAHLGSEIANGQVTLDCQDAQKLNLKKKNFDAAFVCWFLEHVPDPLKVLKRTRKHLKPGGKIYCTEVFNQTFFVHPYSPALAKYWFAFNDYQCEINGHPFIGAQLGNLLLQAGFTDIQVRLKEFHFDSRSAKKRTAFVEYFHNILLSTEATLLREKRVTPADVKQMKDEIEIVKAAKDAVFFYAPCFATARAP